MRENSPDVRIDDGTRFGDAATPSLAPRAALMPSAISRLRARRMSSPMPPRFERGGRCALLSERARDAPPTRVRAELIGGANARKRPPRSFSALATSSCSGGARAWCECENKKIEQNRIER